MEPSIDIDALEAARRRASPPELLEAMRETPAYLVGGAVRDALLGRPVDEVDVAVEGELEPVLARVEGEILAHARFDTAKVRFGPLGIDLARTRRETYESPGALPTVSPAPIRVDLARRDFTINAIAVPLIGELELIDPYDGVADLEAGRLRALHSNSFVDDPTRALRAARYAARFGFELERDTAGWAAATDLGAVSRDRLEAELGRVCAEPEAVPALLLLERWGLLPLGDERRALLRPLAELSLLDPWRQLIPRSDLLSELAIGGEATLERARELASLDYSSDAEAFERAEMEDELVLAFARALGADWLDSHLGEWRRVELTISGEDLLAAGIPEGPAIGRGLRAARNARIDGAVDADPDAELAVALSAARAGAADRTGR